MGAELWLTLVVLVGAIYLFVTEKLPVDVVALLVLASLLVLQLVTPAEALSGFSSQATITVAAMFVLSAGLQRSGVLQSLGEALARIRQGWLLALVMMLVVAAVSGFINNTAAVAVLLPLIITATVAKRLPPSKFLIPLSYAAQFGGVCTLIGTSTNLLVDSLARQSGREGFGLFEFAELGVIFVVVGVVYLMIARSFLLPDLGIPEDADDRHRGRYAVELLVADASPAIGKSGIQVLPSDNDDVALLGIIRNSVLSSSPHGEPLRPGDRLLVCGEWQRIETFRKQWKLEYDRVARDLDGNIEDARLHAEVLIAPGSELIGQTLAGMRFGHHYRARVHGLHRRRLSLDQPLDQVPLAVGDLLLVDAAAPALAVLRNDPGLIVLGERVQPRIDLQRAWLSAAILATVIGVAAIGWLPIVAAAILGCIALVVLRCLEPEEAYSAIDWRVIMLLAGVLPMGIALERSGGADWLALHALGLIGGYGPVATLSAIYLLTAVLTEVMSNNAAAVLVVPIAIAIAESMGVDAKPFLVAVAFAASTSFATPVGYQTNTMVYAAGGYRFADFSRIGVPLNLIFWAMATVLIPRYFPF